MDSRSFDRLARVLGEATDRRAGLKAAFGALLAAGGAAAVSAADARNRTGRDRKADEAAAGGKRNRRKNCRPACEGGFVCQKVGKKRQCVCPSGVTCGAACCASGEACRGGACVPDPQPAACREFGEPCKNVARRCCDGLTCASGQDGSYPVACYRAKGAACASTAECPFGMSCTDGRCVGLPQPEPPACIAEGGSGCGSGGECCAGLTCDGNVCSSGGGCEFPGTNLALNAKCCESSQCATELCWYPQTTDGDPDGTQKECVVATGGACDYDTSAYSPCGLGNECDYDLDVCIGGEYYPLSVPTGGTGCDAEHPCYDEDGAYCSNGTCVARTQKSIKEQCDPATDQCPSGATCTTYGVGSGAANTTTPYCLGRYNYTPSSPTATDECAGYRIWNGKCTEVCNVYLTSGAADTDVARGAALKTTLEAFQTVGGLFYIEPDLVGSKTYLTQEITLDTASAEGFIKLFPCYGSTALGSTDRYVISGGDQNRILNVTAPKPFIAELGTFTAGKATGDGGAIRIDATGNAVINSYFSACLITASEATGNGGGLWTTGSFSLSASTISGCTADGEGGGWYANTATGQTASVGTIASITQNEAKGASAQGAGLYWNGSAASQLACSGPSSAPSITGNVVGTGTAPYDCAYGTTSTSFTPFCNCATKEPVV